MPLIRSIVNHFPIRYSFARLPFFLYFCLFLLYQSINFPPLFSFVPSFLLSILPYRIRILNFPSLRAFIHPFYYQFCYFVYAFLSPPPLKNDQIIKGYAKKQKKAKKHKANAKTKNALFGGRGYREGRRCSAVAAAPTPHDWPLRPTIGPLSRERPHTEDRPIHMEATDWPPRGREGVTRLIPEAYSECCWRRAPRSSLAGYLAPRHFLRRWATRRYSAPDLERRFI